MLKVKVLLLALFLFISAPGFANDSKEGAKPSDADRNACEQALRKAHQDFRQALNTAREALDKAMHGATEEAAAKAREAFKAALADARTNLEKAIDAAPCPEPERNPCSEARAALDAAKKR
jgi:ElaB/YqjD/DUF883 family membrane-anchored ribosome-binding protein